MDGVKEFESYDGEAFEMTNDSENSEVRVVGGHKS